MKEKYSCYEFELSLTIVGQLRDGWVYKIFAEGCPPYYDGIIESDEWYDTEEEARLAAIYHIELLEDGEGHND